MALDISDILNIPVRSILVILGIIIIVFSINKKFPKFNKETNIKLNTAIYLGIFGVLLLVIGLLGPFTLEYLKTNINGNVTATPSEFKINITSPNEGDDVPYSTAVSGTVSGKLPEGRHIWVMINPHTHSDNWWPQVKEVEPWNGLWNIPAYFGVENNDIGTKHNIGVILVNEEENQNLKSYIEQAKKTGNYRGIPLPESAIIMYKITVRRI